MSHSEKKARCQAERYKVLKEKGKCPQCRNDNASKFVMCDNCRKTDRLAARLKTKIRRQNNLCDNCGKNHPKKDRFQCEECLNYHRKRNNKIRDEVFEAYGGYECICCGETIKWFLQIDHIHNNGEEHRRKVNCGLGSGFYEWLKKNNFPPGFQVLCCNCNFAKGKYGTCPHEWEDINIEIAPQAIRSGKSGFRNRPTKV